MLISLKQTKIKFKPRIKFKYNRYIRAAYAMLALVSRQHLGIILTTVKLFEKA